MSDLLRNTVTNIGLIGLSLTMTWGMAVDSWVANNKSSEIFLVNFSFLAFSTFIRDIAVVGSTVVANQTFSPASITAIIINRN